MFRLITNIRRNPVNLTRFSRVLIVREYRDSRHDYSTNGGEGKVPLSAKFTLGAMGALLGINDFKTKTTKEEKKEPKKKDKYKVPGTVEVPLPYLSYQSLAGKLQASRTMDYGNPPTDLKLTLFQYQTCPFCCKVRAFLDYYGVSYNVIEVNPVLKQGIKWSATKKVPILVADVGTGYQVLVDSSLIVSSMFSTLTERKKLTTITSYYPIYYFIDGNDKKTFDIQNKYFVMKELTDKTARDVDETLTAERKWRRWVDEVFVHTISPNVYRTFSEALQAFRWFSVVGEWEKNFAAWERYLVVYLGAGVMYLLGRKLAITHNLKPAVRDSLYDECNQWTRHLQKRQIRFNGGDKPNLADLALYGVLGSIEGCIAFQDILENTAIRPWYEAMQDEVKNHRGRRYLKYSSATETPVISR